MTTHVYTCETHQTVGDCARLMRDRNIGFVPVVDETGRVRGVVTDRDLVGQILADGADPSAALSEFMRSDMVTCHPGDCLSTLRGDLVTNRHPTAVVVNDAGECVGVLSLRDLVIASSADENLHASEFFEAHPLS